MGLIQCFFWPNCKQNVNLVLVTDYFWHTIILVMQKKRLGIVTIIHGGTIPLKNTGQHTVVTKHLAKVGLLSQ